MAEYTRKLPVEAPRQYTLRDAYRGRVWRSRSVVLGKELLSWAIAATLFGFLLDHGLLFSLGFVACVGAVLIMTIGSIFTNQHRVQMIRHGKAASGTMQQAGRILVLHELLKPEREKTFVLKYRYTDDDGQMHHSRIWVCGCARDYFPIHSESPIVYDPSNPKMALPLKLGVMIAPH